jgi:hypothetical protein
MADAEAIATSGASSSDGRRAAFATATRASSIDVRIEQMISSGMLVCRVM